MHTQIWSRQCVPDSLSGFPNYISWSNKRYYIYLQLCFAQSSTAAVGLPLCVLRQWIL